MTRDVEVHVGMADGDVHAADLTFETNRGGALTGTSFRYTSAWLTDPRAYVLSPELALGSGPQRLTGARPVPGAVADTGPDRWGRTLGAGVRSCSAGSPSCCSSTTWTTT